MKKTISINLYSPLPQLSPKSNSLAMQTDWFAQALTKASTKQLIHLDYDECEDREDVMDFMKQECEYKMKTICQLSSKIEKLVEVLAKEENSLDKCAAGVERMLMTLKPSQCSK
ncbi:Hypothetical_protein [Hexamita inflata]|uniref:Hypothetical_protein n=1 Tax=Hexamita inflata TaxID=28002 RepID=A0AA86PNL9_9EUKA|nr:Hypothetical protein HINF_LOCUS29593 [Hexamita inflata]